MRNNLNLCRLLMMYVLLTMSTSQAGATNILNNSFEEAITFEVLIVDELNQPIPYTSLWLMYAHEEAPERKEEDMQRLINRYAIDNDIVSADISGPIPAVLVKWTDANGIFNVQIKKNDFGNLKELPVIIGVLKRGYLPKTYSKKMAVGVSENIVIQLQKDNTQVFDKRMYELDEIRGEVQKESKSWANEQQAEHLQKMHDRLHLLATIFEKENKNNEAAIAYYNLAYLPSYYVVSNDKVRLTGYTRSYDKNIPEKRSNLIKSFGFKSSIPQLHCREKIEIFTAEGGTIWADSTKRQVREQFIADIENCIKTANERVFPYVIHMLSRAYSGVGNHLKACETMQHAYLFEPRYVPATQWPKYFASVSSLATNSYLEGPKLKTFRCEMPS